MIEWLTEIIGEYTPNVYTVGEDVEIIASGMAGVDWTWIMSAILLVVGVFCAFKLVGVFFGGK